MATEETKDLKNRARANEDKIAEFISDFKEFRGEMLEFKRTTERRFVESGAKLDKIADSLTKGDGRMTTIEKTLAEKTTCLFHQEIVERLSTKDKKDEEHDKRLEENEKKTMLIEYRLTPTQALQLNAASIGTVLIAIWEVVKYLFHISI